MLVRAAAVLLLACLFTSTGAGLLCEAMCLQTAAQADAGASYGSCHDEAAGSDAGLTDAKSTACHDEARSRARVVAERLARAAVPMLARVPMLLPPGHSHTAGTLRPTARRRPDIILIAWPLRI